MVTYSNPGPLEFETVIQRADVTGSSAFVAVPVDVLELFGSRGRVPVSATFDGVAYRGSTVSWGGPPLLLVLTSIQRQLGKGPGDSLQVRIESYRAMAYSHQREYAL